MGRRNLRTVDKKQLKISPGSIEKGGSPPPSTQMVQTAVLANEVPVDESSATTVSGTMASLGAPSLGLSTSESPSHEGDPGGVSSRGSSERGRSGGGNEGYGGSGNGGGFIVFTRADYVYHPKPDYPEKARREGWEGTVLLRVLVDQKGRSKRVEVSRGSGFEILDRTALETVKSWRFQAARSGGSAVESWVKIPIVFRLADLKN